VAREDAPTCRLDETVGAVAERARAAGWDVAVAVNQERVVLGLLRREQLDEKPDRRVEEVMRPGPSTFRPHVHIVEMAQYMTEHDLVSAPITTGDGVLVGVLRLKDATRTALAWQANHHQGEHGG
jgi:Mg/Co/Ni transporter MgtE